VLSNLLLKTAGLQSCTPQSQVKALLGFAITMQLEAFRKDPLPPATATISYPRNGRCLPALGANLRRAGFPTVSAFHPIGESAGRRIACRGPQRKEPATRSPTLRGTAAVLEGYWGLRLGNGPTAFEICGAARRAAGRSAAAAPPVIEIRTSEVYESGPPISRVLSPFVKPLGIVRFT
jgi:hypothetical protein